MKVYLDDLRPAPAGWTLAKTADEAIDALRGGGVTELSLDFDLGDPVHGTGLIVLNWLGEAVAEGRCQLPRMIAHSSHPLGRRRLEAQIDFLEQKFTR